mgnify:CR=1 FL=1
MKRRLPVPLAEQKARRMMLTAQHIMDTAQEAKVHNCDVLIDENYLRFFLANSMKIEDLPINAVRYG